MGTKTLTIREFLDRGLTRVPELDDGQPEFESLRGDALVSALKGAAEEIALTANLRPELAETGAAAFIDQVFAIGSPLEAATAFIARKYTELGGAGGLLGATTSAVTMCPDGVGYFRHYRHGSIYWHPRTGAHEVHGIIREKWASLGWERFTLGYPITDEQAGQDPRGAGRVSHFQRGSIYYTPGSGAGQVRIDSVRSEASGVSVVERIRSVDESAADASGAASSTMLDTIGRSVVISPSRGLSRATDVLEGARVQPGVADRIADRVVDRGVGGGRIPERPIAPTQPSLQGAHEVHGAIQTKYKALGGEASFLGYPTTDETGTPDGVGRFNHFQAGSIYWTPNTGAYEVHGLIRAFWASHGWERNAALGYPISDELVPDRRIGHTHPETRRKPIVAVPVDVVRVPELAGGITIPSAVRRGVTLPPRATEIDPDLLRRFPRAEANPGLVVDRGLLEVSPGRGRVIASRPGPEPSPNRFGDFENGVVFWKRGESVAQQLAPWVQSADGGAMSLTAAQVVEAVAPRMAQALAGLQSANVLSRVFAGVTGYSFDGAGVHNRRHRVIFTIATTQQINLPFGGTISMAVTAPVELHVEVSFEPFTRRVVGTIANWIPPAGAQSSTLVRHLHASLDRILWTPFDLLPIDDTEGGKPLAVLSVKTMTDGAVNLFIEPS